MPVQAESFHLNGRIIGFRPQTQKLESPYKTLSNTLAVKGLSQPNQTKNIHHIRFKSAYLNSIRHVHKLRLFEMNLAGKVIGLTITKKAFNKTRLHLPNLT